MSPWYLISKSDREITFSFFDSWLLSYFHCFHIFTKGTSVPFFTQYGMIPWVIRSQGNDNTTNLLILALHVMICQYLGKILMKHLVYSSDSICFSAALLFDPIWPFSIKTWQSSLLSKRCHIYPLIHPSLHVAENIYFFLSRYWIRPRQSVQKNAAGVPWGSP